MCCWFGCVIFHLTILKLCHIACISELSNLLIEGTIKKFIHSNDVFYCIPRPLDATHTYFIQLVYENFTQYSTQKLQ